MQKGLAVLEDCRSSRSLLCGVVQHKFEAFDEAIDNPQKVNKVFSDEFEIAAYSWYVKRTISWAPALRYGCFVTPHPAHIRTMTCIHAPSPDTLMLSTSSKD